MTQFLQKYSSWISLALITALIVSMFLYPQASTWLGLFLMLSSLGMASLFAVQKQVDPYRQGQMDGLRFTRNVLLDILGLLLTIAAASYFGGMAGTSLGTSYGMWAGLITGIASAFLAAWTVRKLWSRLTA